MRFLRASFKSYITAYAQSPKPWQAAPFTGMIEAGQRELNSLNSSGGRVGQIHIQPLIAPGHKFITANQFCKTFFY